MPAKKMRFGAQDFPKKGFQTMSSRLLTLKFSKNILMYNRFAVVVDTSVDKRSSHRNALRRRMREVARRSPNMCADFLFIVRPEAARAPKDALYAELRRMLRAVQNNRN